MQATEEAFEVLKSKETELQDLINEQTNLSGKIEDAARSGNLDSIRELHGRAQELLHLVALSKVSVEKARLEHLKLDHKDYIERLNELGQTRRSIENELEELQRRYRDANNAYSQESLRYPVPIGKLILKQESVIRGLEDDAAKIAIHAAMQVPMTQNIRL